MTIFSIFDQLFKSVQGKMSRNFLEIIWQILCFTNNDYTLDNCTSSSSFQKISFLRHWSVVWKKNMLILHTWSSCLEENQMIPEQPADVVKGQGQEHVLEQEYLRNITGTRAINWYYWRSRPGTCSGTGISQEHNRYKGNQLTLLKIKARNMFWNRE